MDANRQLSYGVDKVSSLFFKPTPMREGCWDGDDTGLLTSNQSCPLEGKLRGTLKPSQKCVVQQEGIKINFYYSSWFFY